MLLLQDFIELITFPPGDLVYHLVTLFAIQLVLGIVVGHWSRQRRDPIAARLLVTGAGFAIARVLLMLVAVLDRSGVLSSNAVLPPLERFLDLAVLLLVAWVFLPILQRYSRLGTVLLLVVFSVTLGLYAVTAVLWLPVESHGMAYNSHVHSTVWELTSITILVLALIASAVRRRHNWGLLACLFAIWLVGHALQALVPIADSYTAGWVRLANLAALPLLAGLVYRHALRVSSAVDQDMTLELVHTLEAVRRIERRDRDIESALESIVSRIAHAIETDMVAIGLALPEAAEKIRVVALHPSTAVTSASPRVTLSASDHPLLASALQTGQQQCVQMPPKVSASSGFSRTRQRIGDNPFRQQCG